MINTQALPTILDNFQTLDNCPTASATTLSRVSTVLLRTPSRSRSSLYCNQFTLTGTGKLSFIGHSFISCIQVYLILTHLKLVTQFEKHAIYVKRQPFFTSSFTVHSEFITSKHQFITIQFLDLNFVCVQVSTKKFNKYKYNHKVLTNNIFHHSKHDCQLKSWFFHTNKTTNIYARTYKLYMYVQVSFTGISRFIFPA